jgi:hypothetical protein
MLTLSDVNAQTNSFDGSLYSDLHKDVYGFRPRSISFASVEEFDAEYKYLLKLLDQKIIEEREEKAAALDAFLQRIEDTQDLIIGCDTLRAINIIADAEGVTSEDLQFYGWGYLEYTLGIKYGAIKTILEE